MSYIHAGITPDIVPADGGFTLAEPGEYEGAVADCWEETSKRGNQMMVVDFEILRNADGSDTDQEGQTCRGWYPFQSDYGKRRLANLLNACGVERDESGGFDDDQLKGSRLCFSFEHRKQDRLNDNNEVIGESTMGTVFQERQVEAATNGSTKKAASAASKSAPAAQNRPAPRKAPPQPRR